MSCLYPTTGNHFDQKFVLRVKSGRDSMKLVACVKIVFPSIPMHENCCSKNSLLFLAFKDISDFLRLATYKSLIKYIYLMTWKSGLDFVSAYNTCMIDIFRFGDSYRISELCELIFLHLILSLIIMSSHLVLWVGCVCVCLLNRFFYI